MARKRTRGVPDRLPEFPGGLNSRHAEIDVGFRAILVCLSRSFRRAGRYRDLVINDPKATSERELRAASRHW